LLRRLGNADRKLVQQRIAAAERAIRELPPLQRPGECAVPHTYWIFPVLVKEPDRLKRYLWGKGFDATRGASNLEPVAAPDSRPETVPFRARQATEQILYLPVYPQVAARDVRRLARALEKFESSK
jgi:dTDP-4-amino-4,6-dideoxygalactose transaminase